MTILSNITYAWFNYINLIKRKWKTSIPKSFMMPFSSFLLNSSREQYIFCLFRFFYANFCLIKALGLLSSLSLFRMRIKCSRGRAGLCKSWNSLRVKKMLALKVVKEVTWKARSLIWPVRNTILKTNIIKWPFSHCNPLTTLQTIHHQNNTKVTSLTFSNRFETITALLAISQKIATTK